MVLTLLMAGTTALYPVVINHAFDMFTNHDRRILYQIPVLVVVVTGLKALAQYFQSVQVQQVVLLVIRELQGRMFAHLTRADLARLEREAPAQLAAHFTTDAATIREALTRAVNGVADVVTVIGLVGSMIYLNWLLSLIAAALYPLAIMPIERIGRRVRKASGGMQETRRRNRRAAERELRPGPHRPRLPPGSQREPPRRGRIPEALQVAAADDQEPLAGGTGAGGPRRRRGGRGHRLRGLARRGQRPCPGRFHRLRGRAADRRPPAARAWLAERGACRRAWPGWCGFSPSSMRKPTIADSPDAVPLPPGRGHVVFDDVRFVYPDGREGLRGLSFEALPGTTVALVGPSGGGKSTALAMIPRLQDASGGAVNIDGADVRSVTLASLRDSIAYVGQDALLFDDTVAANIAMGRPGASQAEIEAAAGAAAAAGFIADLPLGYETVVGPGGQRLSGGQRQRVALARALLRNPRISAAG